MTGRLPQGIVATLLLLALAAPFAPTAGAAPASVTVSNFAFTPSTVNVLAGESVTWSWSSGTHSVDGGVDRTNPRTTDVWCSTRTAPASSCAKTFPTEGTFDYHCNVHPSMKGRVIVGSAAVVTFANPAPGSTASGVFAVSGTAAHASGITKVEVALGSGAWSLATGTTSWSKSVDANAHPNGPLTIKARATAGNGVTKEESIVVTLENPLVALVIASPAPNAGVSGVVNVTGTASHPSHSITGVTVSVDGATPVPAKRVGSGTTIGWYYLWDTTAGVQNGPHTLLVQGFVQYPTQASPKVALPLAVQNVPTWDLSVLSFSGTTGNLQSLGVSTLTVVVRNQGNAVAEDAKISFEYNYKGTWRPIATTTVTVAPFGQAGASHAWSDPTLVGRFNVRVVLDPDNAIAETQEGNNGAAATAAFWTTSVDGVRLVEP